MIEALGRKLRQENVRLSILGQKASTQTRKADQSGTPTNRPTCAPHPAEEDPDDVDENSRALVIILLTKQSNKLNCHWSRQNS